MLCGLLATLCFVSPDLNVFKDLLFTAGHYHPVVLSELLVKSPRIDQAISLSRSTLLIFTSCVGRAGNALCLWPLSRLRKTQTKHLLHSIVELEIHNSYFITYILYILNITFMLMFFFAFGLWRKRSPSMTWNSPCTPRLALNSVFFMLNRWTCL